MAESACLQCISWGFNWRKRAFQAFLTSNWHFWQKAQMSAKCLLSKTEKTQISGQTQIIWVHWSLWACPLISGVQETSMPDPHSCLYLASSDCLNLVSVKIVISVHWPIELNILLLFKTMLFDWPPIPPQFLVLILICDSNESLPFTPGLLWRVAVLCHLSLRGCYYGELKDVVEENGF